MTDQVLNNDPREQNVHFYKWCYHWAYSRCASKGNKGTKGIKKRKKAARNEDKKEIIPR
jgi:hypothetical protein